MGLRFTRCETVNETVLVERVYPKTQNDKLVSVLVFPGEIDHPPVFLVFTEEIASGKMYGALTTMVFNQ